MCKNSETESITECLHDGFDSNDTTSCEDNNVLSVWCKYYNQESSYVHDKCSDYSENCECNGFVKYGNV